MAEAPQATLTSVEVIRILADRMPSGWRLMPIGSKLVYVGGPVRGSAFPVSPEYGGFWEIREEIQDFIQEATTEEHHSLDEREGDPE